MAYAQLDLGGKEEGEGGKMNISKSRQSRFIFGLKFEVTNLWDMFTFPLCSRVKRSSCKTKIQRTREKKNAISYTAR